MDTKGQKIAAFNGLVQKLPPANYALLQALCSFLIDIVENADRNKMNVRNGKGLSLNMSVIVDPNYLTSRYRLRANTQHSSSAYFHVPQRLRQYLRRVS